MQPQASEASQQFGRAVIARLALCLKVATVHQLTNAAVRPSMRSLLDLINPRLSRGEMLLVQTVGESLFLNHEPVRLDNSTYESGETLRAIFERLGVQEVSFGEPLTEERLRDFLAAFQRHYTGTTPAQILDEKFTGIGLRTLETVAPRSTVAGSGSQRLLQAYAQFMNVLERTIRQVETGKDPRLARLRRALQLLFDASQGQESLLLAITQLQRESGGVALHLTATTALTLLMGRRLGLPRPTLIEAAIAAAFHDMARDKVLEGRAAESVAAAMAQSTLDTVLQLSTWSGFPVMLKAAAVAYEHRLPAQGGRTQPGALARLVAVPCAYDLLRHPAPPRGGFPPPQALDVMLGSSGTRFDPLAVRALGGVVGHYPPGTLVMLSNGLFAAVVQRPDPEDLVRVKVRLLRQGTPQPSDWVIDLGDPAQNPERVGVASVVDPRSVQLNVLECLFFAEDLG